MSNAYQMKVRYAFYPRLHSPPVPHFALFTLIFHVFCLQQVKDAAAAAAEEKILTCLVGK